MIFYTTYKILYLTVWRNNSHMHDKTNQLRGYSLYLRSSGNWLQIICFSLVRLTIFLVLLYKAIITVYSENCTKHINTLCRWNAEFLNIRTGCMCSYHRVLNGQPWRWCRKSVEHIQCAVKNLRLILIMYFTSLLKLLFIVGDNVNEHWFTSTSATVEGGPERYTKHYEWSWRPGL